MLNILRADLNRLMRSKALWIGTAIFTVLSLLIYMLFHIMAGEFDFDMIDFSAFGLAGLGIKNTVAVVGSNISVLISILFGVLCTSLICSDFSQNTIQSYMISGNSRAKIFIAKSLVLYIAAIICVTAITVATAILAGALDGWGGAFTTAGFFEFLGRFLLSLGLYCAIMSIFIFIAFGIKRSGPVIGISIAIGYGFNIIVGVVMMMGMGDYFGMNVNESLYNVLDGITRAFAGVQINNTAVPGGEVIRIAEALTVMALTFTAFVGGGLAMFSKKDMK